MHRYFWIYFFSSFWLLSSAQDQGVATYLVDQRARVRSILNLYKDIDGQKTLSKPIWAAGNFYFDTITRQTSWMDDEFMAKIYKEDGAIVELPISSATRYYRFFDSGKSYGYLQASNGFQCIYEQKKLRQAALHYTKNDTLIGSYSCEEAYSCLSASDTLWLYTSDCLSTVINPLTIQFDGLKGGIVYCSHPTIGQSILQSVKYQALEPEKTRLPKGVTISEEPCKSPR